MTEFIEENSTKRTRRSRSLEERTGRTGNQNIRLWKRVCRSSSVIMLNAIRIRQLLADERSEIGKNCLCCAFRSSASQQFATIQTLTNFFHDIHPNFWLVNQGCVEWSDFAGNRGIGCRF